MKICSLCHFPKSLDDFHRNSKSPDGHNTRCKDCRNNAGKKYYQDHKEKYQKYGKKYLMEHKEYFREKSHEWRINNPERAKATDARSYQKHAEKRRFNAREFRRNNPEKARQRRINSYWRDPQRGREKTKQWRLKDPQRAQRANRKQHDKRRTAIAGAPYEYITLEEIYVRDHGICQICHRKTLKLGTPNPRDSKAPSMDHIVPVSHPDFVKFGHVRTNVRLAHFGCNASKHAKGANSQYLLFG